MAKTTLSIPFPKIARRRLGTEAKALKTTPEAAADHLCREAWGQPLTKVLATVLEDARSAIRSSR